MKKIDSYIDSLYKHMDEDSDEVQVLKQEMKSHLLQAIYELKAEGKSEEESFSIAVKRFGDVNQLQNELAGVFSVQRKFAKILLVISLVSLVLSVIFFIAYKKMNYYQYATFPVDLQKVTVGRIESGTKIDEGEVLNIMAKYKNDLSFVAIYKRSINSRNLEAIYPSSFDMNEFKKLEVGDKYLTIFVQNPDSTPYEVRVGFYTKWFALNVSYISLLFFTLYWICFGIWGVIHVYHSKRLKLVWIILFFALNVIGYILFRITRNRSLKLKTI